MVYLCLLHGVKFNANVARGWVEAGLLSFCFSCVVTATGVQFVKSVIAICIALVKRHKMERVYVSCVRCVWPTVISSCLLCPR